MNQKLCQVYTTLLSLFVVVIPSINCHQNSKISVCPGEGIYQSNLIKYLKDIGQGYRSRYNLIDRPRGSCNFCEITKVSDFGTSKMFFYQLSILSIFHQ